MARAVVLLSSILTWTMQCSQEKRTHTINSKHLLWNELQGEFCIPFGYDDESALDRQCTEAEEVQPVTVVKWHGDQ